MRTFFSFKNKTKQKKNIYIYIFIFSSRVAPEQIWMAQSVDSPNCELRIEAHPSWAGRQWEVQGDRRVSEQAASLSGKHQARRSWQQLGAESQHQPAWPPARDLTAFSFGPRISGEGPLGLHEMKALREVPGPRGRAREEGTQLAPYAPPLAPQPTPGGEPWPCGLLPAEWMALPYSCPQPWPTTVMSAPSPARSGGFSSTVSTPFLRPRTW